MPCPSQCRHAENEVTVSRAECVRPQCHCRVEALARRERRRAARGAGYACGSGMSRPCDSAGIGPRRGCALTRPRNTAASTDVARDPTAREHQPASGAQNTGLHTGWPVGSWHPAVARGKQTRGASSVRFTGSHGPRSRGRSVGACGEVEAAAAHAVAAGQIVANSKAAHKGLQPNDMCNITSRSTRFVS